MTGVIATIPRIQFSNALGVPLAGGKLTTYLAGTTTPEQTYQDRALTIKNPTSITLDSTGSCVLWLDPAKSYKFVLKNKFGVIQPGWPVDNISGSATPASLTPTLSFYAKLTTLAEAVGSTLMGFIQAGVGAFKRTVHDKLQETVSVFDFMSDEQKEDVRSGAGLIDVTDAWDKAQRAGSRILIPAGMHRLTDFRPIQGKRFEGEGYYASKIKQGDGTKYAFNCLADATVGPDHVWGVSLVKVGFYGTYTETQYPVNVSAGGSYTVQACEFDFACRNTTGCLRVYCPEAANVYNCSFTVHADGYRDTAVRADGAYNDFNLFLTGSAASKLALDSWAACSTFHKVITENRQVYNGYNCLILDAKVESWRGEPSPFAAIQLNGTNNRLINWALISIGSSKAQCGLNINEGTRQTIIGGWIKGEVVDCPQYSIVFGAGSSGFIADIQSDSPQKVDYLPWDILKNWEFAGDVLTITDLKRRPTRLRYIWATPADGSTVAMQGQHDALYLQANINTLTIELPQNPDDGQLFRVGSSDAIGAINWSPGGSKTMDPGIPTALAAGSSVAMMYLGSQGQSRWVPIS